MNNNEAKLSELLGQLMQERGVTVEKLTATTNIPHRFVAALVNGEFKKLPAKPYVKGYLSKIAVALNVDPTLLLKAYEEGVEIMGPHEEDKLPVNRFAIQKIRRNLVILILIVIVVVGFLSWRMKDILGTPSLQVNLPETTLVAQEQIIKVSGRVSPGDQLTLNQEIVYTDGAGVFEKEINLTPGLNTLEFDVKRFLGRETKVVRQIFYEEQPKQDLNE